MLKNRRIVPKHFTKSGRVGLSFLVVGIVAVLTVVLAAVILPKFAPAEEEGSPVVTSVEVLNNGLISTEANLDSVFVLVKYSDGTSKQVALSEIDVVGLDLRETGEKQVILNYGGREDIVTYKVVDTLLECKYSVNEGGYIEGDATQKVIAGEDCTRVIAIPHEGYEFLRWSDGYPYASRQDLDVSKAIDVYATFAIKTFKVIFYLPDGTTVREQDVQYGGNATPPTEDESGMKIYGYKFKEWSVSYNNITEDTDIYPLYEEYYTDFYIDYTLDAENFPLGTSNAIPYYEKGQVASVNVTANPGRIFVGWSILDFNGNWEHFSVKGDNKIVKVAENKNIVFKTLRDKETDPYTLTFTPEDGVKEIRVKANFVYEESEIKFTMNNTTAFAPTIVEYGQPIGEKFDVEDLTKITQTGYKFLGWYDEKGALNEDGKPVLVTNETTFDRPTKLVAYLEKELYTVVFLKGDNEDVTFETFEDYDETIKGRVLRVYYQDTISSAVSGAYPTAIPTKANYDFKGWYLLGEGNIPTDRVIDKTYKIDSEIIYVYPVFEVKKVALVANFAGSGSIKYRVLDEEYSTPDNPVYIDTDITGKFEMAVTGTYLFRVTAGDGYSLVSLTDNGRDVVLENNSYYDVTVTSPVAGQDYVISATFTVASYTMNITNGNAISRGTITYNTEGESEIGRVTSTEENITARVEHGVSKNIEIIPEEGKYISSVIIDGVTESIPNQSTYCTIVLDNIDSNIAIIITYAEFRYTVTMPETLENGRYEVINPQIDYAKYSSPKIEIEAEEGYYISSVIINGSVINPYSTTDNYNVDGMKVNGKNVDITRVSAANADPRTTYYILSVQAITSNLDVEIEFSRLYYNISVEAEGTGTVSDAQVVYYGDKVSVTANTLDGYYVYGVVVNGDRMAFTGGIYASRMYEIENVYEDYDITFIFSIISYAVTFLPTSDANEGYSVVFEEQTHSVHSGKTFVGLSSGANYDFNIIADEGYYITAVSYKANASEAINEDIAFNSKAHYFKLDNVLSDYTVTVTLEKITYNYDVYITNQGTSEFTVEESPVVGHISSTVFHGNTLEFIANPDVDKEIKIEAIHITNKAGTYTYTATSGYNTAIKEGQYYLNYVDGRGYILTVDRVKSDIDIYVSFTDKDTSGAPFTIETSTVNGEGGNITAAKTSNIVLGERVKISTSVNDGYVLKNLLVNGVEYIDSLINNELNIEVREHLKVVAVYSERIYKATVETVSNGKITASVATFNHGDTFKVKLSPDIGYAISGFKVTANGNERDLNYSPDALTGVYVYDVPTDVAVSDLTFSASFAPKKFELYIESEGEGTVSNYATHEIVDVYYGQLLEIGVQAKENHYISALYVNDVEINTNTLSEFEINTDINKIFAGVMRVNVTGNYKFKVVYAPNVYSVVVASNGKGEVAVQKTYVEDGVTQTTQFMNASELTLHANDVLQIRMLAEEGWHVSELFINGNEITSWKEGTASANNLQEKFFIIEEPVSGNVSIRVNFAVNEYKIKVNATNESENFAQYDLRPTDYGIVSISGHTADAENVYSGFVHGSNVKITLSPRTAKGYFVELFEIIYSDAENTTRILTDAVSANGGSYTIKGMYCDIQAVNVKFARYSYTYESTIVLEQKNSPYIPDNRVLSVKFTNPYAPNEEIKLVDGGKYEYGLNYVITTEPGKGYSRTGFTVNGEDSLKLIRSNRYSGIMSSNMSVVATYTIDVNTVKATSGEGGSYKIYDGNGSTLLWGTNVKVFASQEDAEAAGWQGLWVLPQYTTTTGVIWVTDEGISTTYGTELRFVARPNNTSNTNDDGDYYNDGYMVNSILLNGVPKNIDNGDLLTTTNHTVEGNTTYEVTFAMHRYNVSYTTFTGGTASISDTEVLWGARTTITLRITLGYYLSEVLVNGSANGDMKAALSGETGGSFIMTNVVEDKEITFVLKHKEYDIIFAGDYNKEQTTTDGSVFKAISTAITNEGITSAESHTYSSEDGTIGLDGKVVARDEHGNYVGMRYADSLSIYLTLPVGYDFASIEITMNDVNGIKTYLVRNASELTPDDGSGVRAYKIASVTGEIGINVSYEIKKYTIVYDSNSNGNFYNFPSTISHHDTISFDLYANYGYYLRSFTINDREVVTTSSKNNNAYVYTTDIINGTNTIKLKVDDELINGNQEKRIIVSAVFESLYFDVNVFVKDVSEINPMQNADGLLKVSVLNDRLYYDASENIVFNHDMKEGYSITNLMVSNMPKGSYNANTQIIIQNPSKIKEYSTPATGWIIDMLDFHNNSLDTLYVYYEVAIDRHTSTMSYLNIESVDGNNVGRVIGSSIYYNTTKVYSDGAQMTSPHNYGVVATYQTSISSGYDNSYMFAGYQESINGEWKYVVNGENGITLTNEGRKMEYSITSDRVFRAVFFKLYKVVVEIHPEYKYIQGSFVNGNVNMMQYRQYASLTANAYYYADKANNVILPNVSNATETLLDADGDVANGAYTYYVPSGAQLWLNARDAYNNTNTNPTMSYSYWKANAVGGKFSQVETEFGLGKSKTKEYEGDKVVKDEHVYAYCMNKISLSFLKETVGSNTASEGGEISVQVGMYDANASNGGVNFTRVDIDKTNSLRVDPNTTVRITVTPNENFRFESISELIALSYPDVNGYKQYTTSYRDYTTSPDGRTNVVYYDENGLKISNVNTYNGRISKVELYLVAIDENAIIKVKFWKQVEVSSSISLITDENWDMNSNTNWIPKFDEENSSVDGVYDYNDVLNYDISLYNVSDYWMKNYQFVGYVINGINKHKGLTSYMYPSSYSARFIINDLDGLTNGVTIDKDHAKIENSDEEREFYSVKVVALFVPVYNVVVENEYLYSDGTESIYLDPSRISYKATTYDNEGMNYRLSSGVVEAKTTAGDETYNAFKVLGKINSFEEYNTWRDNEIQLSWQAVEGYKFLSWQYLARVYNSSTRNYEYKWQNIPMANATNANFSLRLGELFGASYMAHLNGRSENVLIPNGYAFNINENGVEREIQAIRIRPSFQRQENVTIVRRVATVDENSCVEDVPADVDINPQIVGASAASANFDFYSVVTLNHANKSGYEFAGWYIADASDTDSTDEEYLKYGMKLTHTNELSDELHKEEIGKSGEYISYYIDKDTGRLKLRLDHSYIVYANYIRIYTLTVYTTNASGNSPLLVNSTPLIKYATSGTFNQPDATYAYSRTVQVTARVGSEFIFSLTTDGTDYDDKYEVFKSTSIKAKGSSAELWAVGGGGDADNLNTNDVARGLKADSTETDINGAQFSLKATAEKTMTISFSSTGILNIKDMYYGSSVQLPSDLAEILGLGNNNSISDANPDVTNGNSTEIDGQTSIRVPIVPTMGYDGAVQGDYATILSIYANKALTSSTYAYGINFAGNSITSKEQTIHIFGANSPSGADYPFAYGGTTSAGIGSSDNPFKITSMAHLRNINALYVGNGNTLTFSNGVVNFQLEEDINLSNGDEALLAPLCSTGNGFDGVLNGNGHTIYGLRLSGSDYLGLFAKIYGFTKDDVIGGVITNLVIGGVNLSGENYVGFLAGYAKGAQITDVTTSTNNEYLQVGTQIQGLNYVGGLVGYAEDNTRIQRSSVTRYSITAENEEKFTLNKGALVGNLGGAGGIAGVVFNSEIYQCYTDSVEVTSTVGAGGLVGMAGSTYDESIGYWNVVMESYAISPNVSSDYNMYYIGGLVGLLNLGTVSSSYVMGDFEVHSAYSESAFNDINDSIALSYGGGAIVGLNTGTIDSCSTNSTSASINTITLTGSVLGGIVGINYGAGVVIETTVNKTKFFTLREDMGTYYSSGIYGVHVGYNGGSAKVYNATTNVTGISEGNLFTTGVNVYEISPIGLDDAIARDKYYNANRKSTISEPECYTVEHADASKLYVGGIVGYNAGTIMGSSFNAGIIINRRSNNEAANLTAIGAIAGYNNRGTINSTIYGNFEGVPEYMRPQPATVGGLIGSFKFVNMNVTPKVNGMFADYIGGVAGYSNNDKIIGYNTDNDSVSVKTKYVATNSVVDYTKNAEEEQNGSGYKVLQIKLVAVQIGNISMDNALNVSLDNTTGVPAGCGAYIIASDYATDVASSWWGISKKEAHYYTGKFRQVNVTRTNSYGTFSVN